MTAIKDNSQHVSIFQVLAIGLTGLAIVFALTAAAILPFEHHFFVDWVGTAFMAATPTQIILGLLWHGTLPDFAGRQKQPLKGILMTAITVIAGAIIFTGLLLIIGKGHGVTPMLIQSTILTIVVTIWLVVIWECWPFSMLSNNPLIYGIATLIASYVIAFLLWTMFFDYGILKEIAHPHYYAELDPSGLFDMWTALVFAVTTASVIIVHLSLNLWPINKLAGKSGQPLRGLIASIYVLLVAFLVQYIFVGVLGMPPVEYLVRVPVCMLFGTFIVNNMMQFSLLKSWDQPLRGVALILLSAIVAAVMYALYDAASSLHVGRELGMGPEAGFEKELWIATAMLGVTFPFIFVVSGFFEFWPIKRNRGE